MSERDKDGKFVRKRQPPTVTAKVSREETNHFRQYRLVINALILFVCALIVLLLVALFLIFVVRVQPW